MENRQQEMGLVPVKSSNVNAIGWGDGTMVVEFRSGARYRYRDVERCVYEALLQAPSIGKYLHRHVKGAYRYERLAVQE